MTNPRGFRIYPFTTKRIGGVEQMKRAGMWPDGDGLYRQVRVRGRIEAVLDWPPSVAYRAGDNPARWRGHLAKLLPTLNMSRVQHHAALHFNQVGKFLLELRHRLGSGLAFCLLRLEMTHRNTTEKSSGLRREW